MTTAPDWTGALCAQVDPELWFPPKGGTIRDAIRTCHRCPLLEECRDYALADTSLTGIWGATTGKQRSRIRVEQRRAAA